MKSKVTKSGRITQHKPKRDKASPLKENRDLKQENRSLKKQLSKLRKQISKMVESHMVIQQMVAEEPQETASPTSGYIPGGCEGCGSTEIKTAQLPIGLMTVCMNCGHRRVEK